MKWFENSPHSEANKWIRQLTDPAKHEHASSKLLLLGKEATPALVEALRARTPNLAVLAEKVIIRMGSDATPALVHSLRDDDPEMRARCAQILSQTKDPQACPGLVQSLQDAYFTVRQKAALALGEIQDPKTLPELLAILRDPEPDVRASSVIAIGRFGDPTTFDRMADLLLEDPQLEVRQASAEALGDTRHPQALPYLLVALRDSFWWYERETAISPLLKAILSIGEPAVLPLIDSLQDPEGTVKRLSAILLGQIGDVRAIEPLGMALYDMHFEVGQAVARSLAKFGEAGLMVLADALHHPESWLRQHAISGLTLSGDTRVVPALLELLDDPDREVVGLVIQSLGTLGDEKAVAPLQAIAADRADREHSSLARQAIEAIGRRRNQK